MNSICQHGLVKGYGLDLSEISPNGENSPSGPTIQRYFPGRVHWRQEGTILSSRGSRLYATANGGQTWRAVLKLPVSLKAGLKGYVPLSRRFFRQDVYHLIPMDEPIVVAFSFGSIFACDFQNGSVIAPSTRIRGSRPMQVCRTPEGHIYYGEYWGERRTGPVHIYGSHDQGRTWNSVYRLDGVRHVHGVYLDPYTRAVWVTTGDEGQAAAMWLTDDHFRTLRKVVGGGQQTRAVQLLFAENFIYFASDSPYEKNHIYRLNRKNAVIEKLQELESSVFYGTKVGEEFFFSTVAEPSPVNETGKVVVWHSKDGENWHRFAEFKKDFWPHKLFQYGQVMFPTGPGDGRHLWLTPYSCRGDQVSLCYDLQDQRI